MAVEGTLSAPRGPLSETVLGVQFEPLPGLGAAQLGAFWAARSDRWPDTKDLPALEFQHEKFAEAESWSGLGPFLRVQLLAEEQLRIRIQMRNRESTRMIQVQNGRFHYNWMARPGEEDYPRYDRVRAEFHAALAEFCDFLAREELGEFRPNQWELTYINQIPKGTLWERPQDLSAVFRHPGAVVPQLGPASVEAISAAWTGEIPPKQGRLRIAVQQGRLNTPDGPEAISVMLTTRGATTPELDLRAGLDLGHRVVNAAFRDIVSADALHYWGLDQ